MKETILNLVRQSLESLSVTDARVILEHPGDPANGDYSSNAALAYAKALKIKPRDLADRIVAGIKGHEVPGLARVEVAGPGFINFYLSKEFFTAETGRVIREDGRYGARPASSGARVIVEYSSPNIAKPFTVGHLRSSIIGAAIANILEFLGRQVIRDNHLGDWGTQFGKLIVALKRWGDEGAIEADASPVKRLNELYVKFHEEAEKDPSLEDEGRAWFARLEAGDAEARRLWKKCIDWSLVEFNRLYARLGVRFDTYIGESFFEDKMAAVLEDIAKAGIARESDGALLIFFADEKMPPLMVRKSDGATLYATRDLATDKYRRDTCGADITVVNEVGIEQSLYFQQLFEAEELLGYFKKSRRVHVAHGHYRFKEGKMSSRKGNVIWLEDLLNEAAARAREINPDTAEAVGIGAVKFNDLKREPKNDIVFDWDEILNLKGDSGPYLQYTAVRAKAILEKAAAEGVAESLETPETDINEVERLLYRFPEAVEKAGADYAPYFIANYLLGLAAAFNGYYAKNRIVEAGNPVSPYRIALAHAVLSVTRAGLGLLGIDSPEKM